MVTAVTTTGPSIPETMKQPTLTFTLDAARESIIVNGTGQAAGISGNNVVRYIPGSSVERQNDKVLVTIPGADAGRVSTLVAPTSDVVEVHVAAQFASSTGETSAVTDTRPVVAGVARGGVNVTGTQVVVLSDAAAKAAPAPVLVSAPPSPTPFNPLTIVSRGQQGDLGPAGPAGLNGAPGAPGPQGPPGPTGQPGASGQPGSSGLPGVSGPAGQPGSIGATGATGADGVAGAPGATGAPGVPGSAGAPGLAGAAGAPGVAGAAGAAGPAGAQRPPGPAGAQGSTGASGADGLNGVDGLNGADGA